MDLDKFKHEIESELGNIIDFWKKNSIDSLNGGFVGRVDSYNKTYLEADKGLVLNARILWSFSAIYNFSGDNECLLLAKRAYDFLNRYFKDNQNGGLYWSVDYLGNPQNRRKQIYGISFAIYGLSEFYKATQNKDALDWAVELFNLIEKYSYDSDLDGYFEAFSENWEVFDDFRLSEKDRNDPKTMNTHLHVIEAYANLYEVWESINLKNRIENLLEIFSSKILNSNTFHLNLFFSRDWIPQSDAISYGHDIEASWLLLNCAKSIKNNYYIEKFAGFAVNIADASKEGLQADGSLIHEILPSQNHIDSHREWWVSAEAMVGFLSIYFINQDPKNLEIVNNLWFFTKENLLDKLNGEWYWGVFKDYSKMMDEDKIGFWKCPYHNVRACIEILKMLK